ncbi:hypothetical protein L7F22_065116 [Adiantum nelumboides]|nr:hypothetical protein [Adiantum nelumboides]
MVGLRPTSTVSYQPAGLHGRPFQHSRYASPNQRSSLVKTRKLRAAPTKGARDRGLVPHFLIKSKAVAAEPSGQQLFQLQEKQSRSFHQLPSGLKMEVIEHLTDVKENRPTLVFLHGSYHAAWCWAIHWLPFFSSQGYDCFALSFLGQVAAEFAN